MTRSPQPRSARLPTSSHPARWPVLLALGVVVVLVHGVLLDAIYGLRQPASLLSDMAVPMYTRVLAPAAPATPDVAEVPAADPVSTRAVSAAAAPTPRAKASAAQQAKRRKRAASAPDPDQALASQQPSDRGELADDPPGPGDDDASDVLAHALAAASDSEAHAHASQATPSVASASPAASVASVASAASDTGAQPATAAASRASPQPAGASADATIAEAWPPNTRLNYQLGGNYRGELHGTARVLWQKDGARYQAQVDLDLGFLATMRLTSQGEMTAHSLKPRVYEELVRKKRRNVRLGDDSIHLANGETAARPPNVQDTASQFIELSHRFASGQVPLAVGQTVQFALVRPNRVAHWVYDVVEETHIHLPSLGPTRALLVRPRPVDGEKQNVSAQMWLAPSLQYLPVRIVLSMGGGEHQVDLMLDRIDQGEGTGKPAP